MALYRDADTDCARELAGRALDVVDDSDDVGRFDALEVLGNACWWEGDLDEVERHLERAARDCRAHRAARPSERRAARARRHLQPAARAGACPEPLDACDRAGARERRSPTTRGWTLRAAGRQALIEGTLDEAEAALDAGAGALRRERSSASRIGRTLNLLAIAVWQRGDLGARRALLRDAIRVLKSIGDRGHARREPAAARAGSARSRAASTRRSGSRSTRARLSAARTSASDSTTRLALGLVRAAQGRDERGGAAAARGRRGRPADRYRRHRIAPLEALAAFLRDRDARTRHARSRRRCATCSASRRAAPLPLTSGRSPGSP